MLFLGVVFSNTLIGTIQELRARAMLNKLRLLDVRPVRVIRDGDETKCPPDKLVLGDLAIFTSGDQLPADAVITGGSCAADESLLTGESEPISRKKGDLLMSGSFLTEGKVTAQLIAVGDNSYAARLTREAKKVSSQDGNDPGPAHFRQQGRAPRALRADPIRKQRIGLQL